MASINNVIAYWRNALADMDRIGLNPGQLGEGVRIPTRDLSQGQLSHHQVDILFNHAKSKQKAPASRTGAPTASTQEFQTIEVMVLPFQGNLQYCHGEQKFYGSSAQKLIFPLKLMAKLRKDGTLIPNDKEILPWMDRQCLAPNEKSHRYPILGKVEHVDGFYNQAGHQIKQKMGTWHQFYQMAQELYEFVVTAHECSLESCGYHLVEEALILACPSRQGMSRHLLKTYEQYLSNEPEKMPSLLQQFAALTSVNPLPPLTDLEVLKQSKQHLAQVDCRFGLSISQRVSLGHFYDGGDLITIHGPPGTGKTTLLASIILSKWVERAVAQARPPVMVVASTNNLAVTNVLNGFKDLLKGDQPLAKRWLPGLNSHGLYLCSMDKVKEAKFSGYLYRTQKKTSDTNLLAFYSPAYLAEASHHFLTQFGEAFQHSVSTLVAARDFLHKQLVAKYDKLQKLIETAGDIAKHLIDFQTEQGSIEKLIEKAHAQEAELCSIEAEQAKSKEIRKSWFRYKNNTLKWSIIFQWLPIARSRLSNQVQLFSMEHEAYLEAEIDSVNALEQALKQKWADLQHRQEMVLADLDKAQALIKTIERYTTAWKQVQADLGEDLSIESVHDFSRTGKDAFSTALDKTLRYELFLLATHYWEVRWLLEADQVETYKWDTKGRQDYWTLQSMITPCIVTTLHSGPAFFNVREMDEFVVARDLIDCLIIDEAGQVLPAIAGAMVSIAKQAVFVGDKKQIQPVSHLSLSIDVANAKKFKLWQTPEQLENLKQQGILCSIDPETSDSLGSLILLGQAKAKYRLSPKSPPGLMLREHWRCASQIIQYCNELCYDNQLIFRESEPLSVFPRLGYAHVDGEEQLTQGSRVNRPEAQVIVDWLSKNQEKILKTFSAHGLDDCVGIVTPFASQAQVIKSHLAEKNLKIKSVGTVHSLQGAEKALVIFSPVYTQQSSVSTYFFDRSTTLLNVAVSRAKQAFLVFGDMSIFDPERGRLPSALLAKYLFSSPENEVKDISQPRLMCRVNETEYVEQITTLAHHRAWLARAFTESNQQLRIVSPYLSANAIADDTILEKIAQAASLIDIQIVVNPYFNQRPGFEALVQRIERAGAEVILIKRMHSKLLIIDNRILIQGSFNWLSASRNPHYANEESSILYQGQKATQFIKEVMDPIDRKRQPIGEFGMMPSI